MKAARRSISGDCLEQNAQTIMARTLLNSQDDAVLTTSIFSTYLGGATDIAVSLSLTRDSEVTKEDFAEQLRAAWIRLRYDFPELAAQTSAGDAADTSTYWMTYTSPANCMDLQSWSDSTVLQYRPQTAEDFCTDIAASWPVAKDETYGAMLCWSPDPGDDSTFHLA